MSRLSKMRTAYGKAMKETNGNKEVAKAAQKEAESKHWVKMNKQFSKEASGNHQSESNFDSDLNGNGTNWHTAEDL